MPIDRLPVAARPRCGECPFRDPTTGRPRHDPVMGTCLKSPKGVLVGESPGGEEVDQGEVFVGRTGQWLNRRLDDAKLARDDMALVNVIGCQPPKGMKTDSNMGHAAHACAPLFERQFAAYRKAKVPTLAMGKWAAWAVAQSQVTIETGRGFIRPNHRGWWLATWHPTYAAFYNPWKTGEFTNDVDRFRRLIDGKLEPEPSVVIRPTVKDVKRLLAASGGWVAVDIETRAAHGHPAYEGKDPTRAELRTIALGTPNHGVAHWWGSDVGVQSAIIRVLNDAKVTKVFHNGWFFDLRVLARYGIVPKNVVDTRDMRRAVSATSRLSLRFLASVYSDFAPWKEDEK